MTDSVEQKQAPERIEPVLETPIAVNEDSVSPESTPVAPPAQDNAEALALAEPATVPTVQVPGVGAQLKAAREAVGMSIQDLSQAIKISPRVIEQAEADAWSQMPSLTFARAFVRGYAKWVKLDADPLIRALDQATLPKAPDLDIPTGTNAALPVAGQSRRGDRLVALAGIGIVALAVILYFLVPESWLGGSPAAETKAKTSLNSETTAPAPVMPPPADAMAGAAATPVQGTPQLAPTQVLDTAPPAQSPLPTPVAPPVAPAAAVAPASVVAPALSPVATPAPAAAQAASVLKIEVSQTSWIEVKDKSGNKLLSENVKAGEARTVSGNGAVYVWVGNVDGVKVMFKGQQVNLKPHTSGKTARFTLE